MRQYGFFISIQQPNRFREWEKIPISKIQDSEENVIVLGRAFRILVNEKVVYENVGRYAQNFILEKEDRQCLS